MSANGLEAAPHAASAEPPAPRPRGNGVLRGLAQRPTALAAACWLVVLVAVAVVGPWLAGDAATQQALALGNLPPLSLTESPWFVLGSDPLGRSVLARIVLATRTTILIASMSVLLAAVLGTTLGIVAGYRQGAGSQLIMRLTDVIMSFPSLLLAVVILFIFDAGIANLVVVLAITRLPVYIRVSRAETLEIREREFVEASVLFGTPTRRILRRHALPNVAPSIAVLMPVEFAFVMLAESSLSFLGIGIQPPDVTWGLMVAQGRSYIVEAWWLTVFAGLAIVLATASANVLARWLQTRSGTARVQLEGETA